MIITLLSFPRFQYKSDSLEAGRFWLALSVTGAMFYLAVLTGFGAFIFSGLATYNQIWVVLMPAVPGMVVMLLAGVFLHYSFWEISPGMEAVQSYLRTLVSGGAEKHRHGDTGVIGQLVGSDAFWEKLQHTLGAPPGRGGAQSPSLLAAAYSATSLPNAADTSHHPFTYVGANDADKVAAQQQQLVGQTSGLVPLRLFSRQRRHRLLRRLGSSFVVPGSASSTFATTPRGGDAASSTAGDGGGTSGGDGGNSGGGGSGGIRARRGLLVWDAASGSWDQAAPLPAVAHPAGLREIRTGT